MKKLLTVLLTIVMAVCLVNLNNSHTKADEENQEKTFTFDGTSWDTSPAGTYQKDDIIHLVNNDSIVPITISVNGVIIENYTSATKDYKFQHNGITVSWAADANRVGISDPSDHPYVWNGTAWNPTSPELSYNAGDTIEIMNRGTGGGINFFVNGIFDSMVQNTKTYLVNNNGTKLELSDDGFGDGVLYITDTAPTPTPTPSEPVVKDESCEKVIGPTWHWNESKGVCEEYSTVGTSTR